MPYTNQTIDRYLYGGDLYGDMEASYGTFNADYIAALAASGDPIAVATEVNQLKNGQSLNTSTSSILWGQLTTDPLAAPLAGLNNILGSSFLSLLKNPWVLVTGALVLFFALGGFDFLKRHIAKR